MTYKTLILFLCVKAAAILLLITYGEIGLGPDEAQYWTWSRHPDWGYYSKPPGIAWEILLGTSVFGNTELGVRILPVAIGFALPLALFFLAKQVRLSPSACFWSAICFAASPLGILSSFLAITDGGMILFWILACISLVGSVQRKEQPHYLLLGLYIGLGALFKWPIYSLWLIVGGAWLLCPWIPSWRSLRNFAFGIFTSFLGLIPSVYWNATHEWATFKHVLATLNGGHSPEIGPHTATAANPIEFLGAQALLVSPILFILLLLAWGRTLPSFKTLPKGIALCGLSSLALVAFGAAAACTMKMQGNWLVFAYPTAFVFLAWYACEYGKKKWMIAGVALSIVLGTIVYAIPSIQSHQLLASWQIPYKVNPFRHNIGWNNLASVLTEAGYQPDKDFLFADKYQTTSILSFYGPQQKQAYFLNLWEIRKNQFSFWPTMTDERVGKRGFFIVVENVPQLNSETLSEKYLNKLKPYFTQVHFIGTRPLFHAYGKTVKGALIYECEGYNGKMPINPEKY